MSLIQRFRMRTTTRSAVLVPVLIAGLVTTSCRAKNEDAPPLRTEVVDGVPVTTLSPSGLSLVPRWRLDSTPLVEIAFAATVEDGLHRVVGVQAIEGGRIVVGEQGSQRLLFFDTTGKYQFVRGRRGHGPGEFTEIEMLSVDDPRFVAVADAPQFRVSVLDDKGNLIEADNLGKPVFLKHRFIDGTYVARLWRGLPQPAAQGTVVEVAPVRRIAGDGTEVSNYGTFAGEPLVLRQRQSGPRMGHPPFRQSFLIAARDSLVALAAGHPYEVRIFRRTGERERVLRLQRPARRVTREHVHRYRDSVLSRYAKDPYTIREWTMLSADDVFPDDFPEIGALRFDRAGALWVRDYSTPDDTVGQWTVFRSTGEPLGRISLPNTFVPYDILSDRLLGVVRNEEGLERVVVLRYHRD